MLIFDNISYQNALFWALLSLPFKLFSLLSNQVLRNEFKKRRFVIFNVFTSLITISSSIIMLNYTSFGLSSIFIAIVIGDILVLPFRFFSISKYLTAKFDFKVLRSALEYGVPFLPVSIAYWVFSGADRFMLEKLTDLETVGQYTIAVTLSGVVSVIAGGIGNAWSPIAIKTYEKDPTDAKILYTRF